MTKRHLYYKSQDISMKHTKVTVGLVVFKEKESLNMLFSSLKQQEFFSHIGEILVTPNSPCQVTLSIVRSFMHALPIKILPTQDNHIGKARALIVKKALYPLIAFTDGDCKLPQNWLHQLLQNWHTLAPSQCLALAGPNRLPEDFWWQKMMNLSLSYPLGHSWSPQAWIPAQPHKTYHIPTTNSLFLKDAILKAGNFSTINHPHRGEDLELGLRLKQLGHLYLCPTPIVQNHYALSYWKALKRLFNFGQTRGFYKNKIFFINLLFVPTMLIMLVLSVVSDVFLLGLIAYITLLFVGSACLYYKSKNHWSMLVPAFWFMQHLAYSLGTFYAFCTHWIKPSPVKI